MSLRETKMYTEKYIRENLNKLNVEDWKYISLAQKLSEDFIREFSEKLDWENISCKQELSESFICEFKNNVNWGCISQNQKLSESFIIEFKDKVNWNYISQSQKLSEPFIIEFKDKVNWNYISKYQKLVESFIREFKGKVNWYYISQYQKLSESFIGEFQDKIDWYCISVNQKLSEFFIKKFQNKVRWNCISCTQPMSLNFIKEFKNKINIEAQLKNHHNKLSYKQKLEIAKGYAKKYNLKHNSRYLYAYREHDRFDRGLHNKTMRYTQKSMYSDWRCDLNAERGCSFGLGIFPTGNVKVRIKIKDIGCWPKNTSKLRVWAFEII